MRVFKCSYSFRYITITFAGKSVILTVFQYYWVYCNSIIYCWMKIKLPVVFLFNINPFFRIMALKAACPLYTQRNVNFWHILDGWIFMAVLGFTSEFEVAALLQVFWFCNETLAHFVVIQLYRAILRSFSLTAKMILMSSSFLLKNRSTWILQNKRAFRLIITNCCQGACFPLSTSWQNTVCLYRRLSLVIRCR